MNRFPPFLVSILAAAMLGACAASPSPAPQPMPQQPAQQPAVKHEYLVSHILCRSEAEADAALERIRAGMPYDEAAVRYSIDANRDNGGHIAQWVPADAFVPAFADEVRRLAPGDISAKPVHTEFGWHIVRVDAVR